MKLRVLGCSGAIAKDCRTTSFLLDTDVLIDAGTGVGDLSLAEMRTIDHVFLTHSHLDHIAALPLLVDAIASQRNQPINVYALGGTIAALKAHIFNNVIWPDFSRIPSAEAPFVRLHEITVGQPVHVAGKTIEPLPAVHTVPACGYAVSSGGPHWVFTGDTERNPAFWARLQALDVAMLVIETAFSNREQELARRSLHLSPATLSEELGHLDSSRKVPVYITHTKPSETVLIMAEIDEFDRGARAAGQPDAHDIRWLEAGQQFEI
ncbi:MAG TPA: 3',5'-cyclic-nucleotide phosphodiesterase [Pseudorhodoferax sp.]|jgi:ribonuclease BN (tRNA processing enzyme)|nr:3',5'-cyclic-nucleotide phosphodiesterase [Pseudorhodoferax sp.]